MMRQIRNERGIALVTSLLLTLLTLAFAGVLLYLVTQGIKVSSASKTYRNALEASQGGLDVFTKDLIPQIFGGAASSKLTTDFSGITLNFVGYTSCVKQKLYNSTADWGTTVCGANAAKFDPNIGPKQYPDATFTLKGLTGQGDYTAYAQIVDTVKGNSDKSGIDALDSGAGVTGTGSGVSPMHVPAVYTIEVQGEKASNPLERARLSVLYVY